jgi:predicted secreted protein
MSHISGKVGAVYTSALLIENCEDAFNEQVIGGCAQDVGTGKVGTYCATTATTTIGADTLIASEVVSKDLSAYDGVYWWAKSTVNTAADDLQLHLSQHGDCATAEEKLAYPALTADTWKQCFVKLAAPSGDSAIISVGVYQHVNLADATFSIDDVEALSEVDGIKSWTLDYTADTLETTDFGSAGVKEYIIAGSGWAGSFEGLKDGVPLSIGSEVYLVMSESDTASQNWIGKAIITGVSANVAHDGIVTYSYTYQGTGALEAPSA